MKALDQADAGQNEDSARDQRAQDAPEQNAVLQFAGNAEESEDDQKDEQIVDAERQLDQIAGRELKTLRATVPEVNEDGECRGQSDPHRAPAQRLAET